MDPRSNIIIQVHGEIPMMTMLAEMLPLLVTYISLQHCNYILVTLGLEMLVYLMGRNTYSGFTNFLGTILRSEVTKAIDCKLTI